MRRFCDNHPIVTRLRLEPLGLLAWLGLAAGSALAQPANDDFANARDLGTAGTGSVTGNNIIATGGQTYNISVDGYNFGIPQGDISLSWTTNTSGAMAGGDYRFTSSLYPVSEYESSPAAIDTRMGFIGPRMTVTRTGGHDGR